MAAMSPWGRSERVFAVALRSSLRRSRDCNRMTLRWQFRIFLVVVAASLVLGSCSDRMCCEPPPPSPVSSITVTPTTVSLSVGDTVRLSATPRDASGQPLSGYSISWQSGGAGVVTVDPHGLVQAVGPGTADVIASSEGTNATATITVSTVALPPGMSLIAFVSSVYLDAPHGGIKVIAADRSATRTVTLSGGDWDPAWSPDGTKLAFESDRANAVDRGDIFVVSADGSGLLQLTSDESDDREPAWSSDGHLIAFDHWGGIWVVNAADGSGLRQVTQIGAHPSWSPDGSKIVFTVIGTTGGAGIWLTNRDGSGLTQLTTTPLPALDDAPAWSPDGRHIAFQRAAHSWDPAAVYLMNADGTGVTQLTLSGRRPSWSPDNRMLVYEDSGVYVIGADGSGLSRIGDGFAPAWTRVGAMPPPRPVDRFLTVAGGNGQTDSVMSALPLPLSVRVTDAGGAPVPGVVVHWTLDQQALADGASISATDVTTDAAGIAGVVLTLGRALGTVEVQASTTDGTPNVPGIVFSATATTGGVATVLVSPNPAALLVQDSVQLRVALLDANSFYITGRPIAWASDNPLVATVDTNGLVKAVGGGSALITATADGRTGIDTIHVVRPEDVIAWLQGDWVVSLGFGNPRVSSCHSTGFFHFVLDSSGLGGSAGFQGQSCVALPPSPISSFRVSSTSFLFTASSCSFVGALPSGPPTLLHGTVRCGVAAGRWTASRSPSSMSVSSVPTSIVIPAVTAPVRHGAAATGPQ